MVCHHRLIEIALWHGCFPVNLLHTFRTHFLQNISDGLLLNFLMILLFSREIGIPWSHWYCKAYTYCRNNFFTFTNVNIRILQWQFVSGSTRCFAHYSPLLLFYNPWKHQKTFRFSDVFRWRRKTTPGCNGLKLHIRFYLGSYGDKDPTEYEINSDSDDDLPFACFICRESFRNPVVTKCKHYFCEKCALNHYKKTKRCFVCAEQTFGVFNPAKDIIKRMKDQKAKEDKRSNEKDVDTWTSMWKQGN